jgi:hypothetical protein
MKWVAWGSRRPRAHDHAAPTSERTARIKPDRSGPSFALFPVVDGCPMAATAHSVGRPRGFAGKIGSPCATRCVLPLPRKRMPMARRFPSPGCPRGKLCSARFPFHAMDPSMRCLAWPGSANGATHASPGQRPGSLKGRNKPWFVRTFRTGVAPSGLVGLGRGKTRGVAPGCLEAAPLGRPASGSLAKPERFSWEESDCEADACASRGVSEARAGTRPVTSERRRICESTSSKHDRSN